MGNEIKTHKELTFIFSKGQKLIIQDIANNMIEVRSYVTPNDCYLELSNEEVMALSDELRNFVEQRRLGTSNKESA